MCSEQDKPQVFSLCFDNGGALAHGSQSVRSGESDVWLRILDPALLAFLVAGAVQVEQVDGSWPGEGASLRYSFGRGAFKPRGYAHVRSQDPKRHRIEIEVHGWEPAALTIGIALRPEARWTHADVEVVAAVEGSTTSVEVLRLLMEQRCRAILERISSWHTPEGD